MPDELTIEEPEADLLKSQKSNPTGESEIDDHISEEVSEDVLIGSPEVESEKVHTDMENSTESLGDDMNVSVGPTDGALEVTALEGDPLEEGTLEGPPEEQLETHTDEVPNLSQGDLVSDMQNDPDNDSTDPVQNLEPKENDSEAEFANHNKIEAVNNAGEHNQSYSYVVDQKYGKFRHILHFRKGLIFFNHPKKVHSNQEILRYFHDGHMV